MAVAKFSPMLEQYFGMKAKHPEAILLSRVGDFYEAYGEDAETIARALQIALTSKEAGAGQRVAMAGVPHHALAGYLARLVAQRFVVALAEQLEVPQPNRLVRRDVVRLVTPGTLIEEQLLDGKANNYLAAVAAVGETFALAYADVSTSHSAATAIAGEDAYDELLAELARIGPVEIVADLPADLRATIATSVESLGARLATPTLGVVGTRDRRTFDGFSMDESLAIHRALEALDAFVKRTGVTNGAGGQAEPNLYRRRQFLALDPATRKHLELTRAQGQNPRATLLATLDACATSMGSRMLARWILAPLVDAHEIARRQDAVSALVAEHARRETRARDPQRRVRSRADRAEGALPARDAARPRVAAPHARRASAAASGGAAGARAAGRADRRFRRDARRPQRDARRRAAGADRRRRGDPARGRCGARGVRGAAHRRALEALRTRGARTRAHRHQESQGEVREPLRLCHRGEQERMRARCRPSTSASRR